jgi:hypothetical protein
MADLDQQSNKERPYSQQSQLLVGFSDMCINPNLEQVLEQTLKEKIATEI